MTPAPSRDENYILAIEAATPSCGVALARVRRFDITHVALVAQAWRAEANPASRWLLADIERLLIEVDASRKQIVAIAVTHGPGSFTGLRLGLSLAKTLAHGLGIPIYCYSTLEMLASRMPLSMEVTGESNSGESRVLIAPLLDARRGEVYSGLYAPHFAYIDGPRSVREDRVETIASFLSFISDGPHVEWRHAEIWFSGSGAAKYRADIGEALGTRAHFVPSPWKFPAADAAALRAAYEWSSGISGLDPLAAEPVYLRVSDAEKRFPVDAPFGSEQAKAAR